ncbi:CopG family transcriptional regulator [Bifidobacterium sp. ESL0800]|uniref:CopG family transcriptional regulator n=1 Tax=Bifidobacterium sp. ESL0800 TaxID=2983236 RepID=UPI0023F71481|nr:CopG family transcriptional regulator [Bifidobacterium sp. ESL0800]WEV75793.1 CopG family transcriptional regulator [Bifidobacterium sp. ESL0800]
MTMSKRDKELLKQFGMTQKQVETNAEQAESEMLDDGLRGHVYYGLHLDHGDEHMVNISLRIPKSILDMVDTEAKKYHISRSEYMRRRLSAA